MLKNSLYNLLTVFEKWLTAFFLPRYHVLINLPWLDAVSSQEEYNRITFNQDIIMSTVVKPALRYDWKLEEVQSAFLSAF